MCVIMFVLGSSMLEQEAVLFVWKWEIALLLAFLVAIVFRLAMTVLHGDSRRRKDDDYGMPFLQTTAEQPYFLPFFGQVLAFLKYRPWDLIMNWHRSYGPIVGFPLLGVRHFSIASPRLLQEAMQSKVAAMRKDVHNTMKPFMVILGSGIVSSDGRAWLEQRARMSHPLRHDILGRVPRQTLAAVQRLFQVMDEAGKSGQCVDMGSLLRHLTLQVISGTFLSLSAQESDDSFGRWYLPIVDEANARVWHPYRRALVFLPAFWKFQYHVYRLNTFVSHLIQSRWQLRQRRRWEQPGSTMTSTSMDTKSETDTDVLDDMLASYEKDFPQETVLPLAVVRQFRDEIKTFMLAGHETSAAMMTWTALELMNQPILREQVAQESSRVFSKMSDWLEALPQDLPPPEELAKLVLAEACLKESLRKYSVVPIVARRLVEDLELDNGKYFLPKGSTLLFNLQAVHLDPQLWPNPMRYDPYRFLSNNSTTDHPSAGSSPAAGAGTAGVEPYTFLPFIAGPRNCLGQYLALLESKMVMGMITQRYQLTLPANVSFDLENWSHHHQRTDEGLDKSGAEGQEDPRHRYMVPVIPKTDLMLSVTRNV